MIFEAVPHYFMKLSVYLIRKLTSASALSLCRKIPSSLFAYRREWLRLHTYNIIWNDVGNTGMVYSSYQLPLSAFPNEGQLMPMEKTGRRYHCHLQRLYWGPCRKNYIQTLICGRSVKLKWTTGNLCSIPLVLLDKHSTEVSCSCWDIS